LGLIKYNIHLFVFFFALSFLIYGHSWTLPDLLRPILFIVMIFGFIFSSVAGGRFKKAISIKKAEIWKSAWTAAFMLSITISTIFYELIEPSQMVIILTIGGLYLLSSIFSILKKEEASYS
jgi:hypothetical protein